MSEQRDSNDDGARWRHERARRSEADRSAERRPRPGYGWRPDEDAWVDAFGREAEERWREAFDRGAEERWRDAFGHTEDPRRGGGPAWGGEPREPYAGGFGGRGDERPDFERDRGGYGGRGRYSGPESQGFERPSYAGRGPKGYRRSDARVLEDASQALEDDPRIDASDIEVTCQSGEIVLKGTVSDRRTKRLAEECVERTAGVKDVRNELRLHVQGGRGGSAGQSDPAAS